MNRSNWARLPAVLKDGVRGTMASFRPSSPSMIKGLNNSAVGWIACACISVMSAVFAVISSDRLYFALGFVGFGAAAVVSLLITGLEVRRASRLADDKQER